jgi:hypothetical protein
MLTLEEAIKHCEEVAEEQEDFDKFQCGYCKPGCEDGVRKDTCRFPSNIPEGCSWGECSEQNCPLFPGCLECASEHRQLAEWLRTLKEIWDSGDCNDCGNRGCLYKPKLGQLVRYNCPFYSKEVNADDSN